MWIGSHRTHDSGTSPFSPPRAMNTRDAATSIISGCLTSYVAPSETCTRMRTELKIEDRIAKIETGSTTASSMGHYNVTPAPVQARCDGCDVYSLSRNPLTLPFPKTGERGNGIGSEE